MKKKLCFIYDNRNKINPLIRKIIALNSYGEIIYKRKRLKNIVQDILIDFEEDIEFIQITTPEDVNSLIELLETNNENRTYINYFSSTIITDKVGFKKLLEECQYLNEIMIVDKENPTMMIFNSLEKYKNFLISADVKQYANIKKICNNNCLKNISIYENFLKFFLENFETRYFNSIQTNENIITKISADKKKIKAEHDYYYLLPKEMRDWFVMPYNYKETEENASYCMKKIEAADLAIQWVHETISLEDFRHLIDKIMVFIDKRPKRKIEKEKYFENMKVVYESKVINRLQQLKRMPEFKKIEDIIKLNTKYASVDQIMDEYMSLYKDAISKYEFDFVETIGHGDLCFSNMLYYKEMDLLKFIDVKGATREDELWIDPYYDLAKLSHSICGNYDFFNYNMVDIVGDNNLSLKFEKKDTSKFIEIFKQKIEEKGYNYRLIRIFEISLFLSMLPLHMDNRIKVLSFLLNSIRIMEELKKGK